MYHHHLPGNDVFKGGAGSLFEDGRAREIALSWSSSPLPDGYVRICFCRGLSKQVCNNRLGIALALSDALPAVSAFSLAYCSWSPSLSSLIAVISSFGGRMSARRLGFCSLVYYAVGSSSLRF